MPSGDSRALRSRLLLSLAALLVTLAAGELLLRGCNFPDRAPLRDRTNERGEPVYAWTPEFHHNYRPDQTFLRHPARADEFPPVRVSINSLGMRGALPGPKAEGERRLLLLGDSFLQADEVFEQDTVGPVLERRLGASGWRVLQHGMFSWAPVLEWNWLRRVGLSLEPDVLLLFLCVNDFFDTRAFGLSDGKYAAATVPDADGAPLRFLVTEPPSPSWWQDLQWVRLGAALRAPAGRPVSLTAADLDGLLQAEAQELDGRIAALLPDARTNPVAGAVEQMVRLYRPASRWDRGTQRNVALSFAVIDRIAEECRKAHVRLALTYAPFPYVVAGDENVAGREAFGIGTFVFDHPGIEARLREYSRQRGWPFVELREAFVRHRESSDELLYFRSEGHWNPRGHRLVADTIAEQLRDLWATAGR